MSKIPCACMPTRHHAVHLHVFRDEQPATPTLRWRINGFPATLLIWSVEEWERLKERPADAQFHPLGLWCALRCE